MVVVKKTSFPSWTMEKVLVGVEVPTTGVAVGFFDIKKVDDEILYRSIGVFGEINRIDVIHLD